LGVITIQEISSIKFQKPRSEKQFREMVLLCIDRGLDMFGISTKEVVYWYLAQQKAMPREAIIDKPEEFIKEVESFFGLGSGKIRNAISKELISVFDLSSASYREDESQLSLKRLISDARKRSL
jgi:hypothetical protein